MIHFEAQEAFNINPPVSYTDEFRQGEKIIGFRIEHCLEKPDSQALVMYGQGRVLRKEEPKVIGAPAGLILSFEPFSGDKTPLVIDVKELVQETGVIPMPEEIFEGFVSECDNISLDVGNFYALQEKLAVERRGSARFH